MPAAARRPVSLDAIPSLVTASADWIERKSAEFADHTVLLGTTMPPEAAIRA
jgi:hypothetical protein